MSELFRHEAVGHATGRLHGEVLLATPMSVRTLGLLLVLMVFGALAFLFNTSYARKATISGVLVPDQGMVRATVQATGTLQSVMLQEGDHVVAGDKIAIVSLAAVTESGNVGETISRSLISEAAAARAKAEATIARLEVEYKQANRRLVESQAEQDQIKSQISLQIQRVELAQADLSRGLAVAAKGFMARKDVDARRSALLLAQQELSTHRRALATSEREIADTSARITSIPLEMASARAEAESAAATLQQRTAESEAKRLQFVTAPVSGRIAALPVSPGQTLNAGSTVAVIIPEGGRLEAELFAPSRAIGFVRAGQEVHISLQAFPYQRFGTIAGHIRIVSTTVIAPSEVSVPGLNVQEPTFRIRVSLAHAVVRAYGESYPLQPGMQVSAEVVFDRRTLVQWLFDPIYAVARRA
jgi:membrane fusion protein